MNALEFLKRYMKNADVAMGAGVVFILALIIIPLPGFLLDVLIVVSILSGMLIMMTALSNNRPADFSVFPTLLLVTTIYRLAVNISTTRMILTSGATSSSAMVETFGTFVVGGSGTMGAYVVGAIIFIILTLMQIMVITKGATRVSEVAARFALDSLPGKQLAIDSDLAAGYITEKEAKSRREYLQREMDFYGAMDGASKFVQGDVRLGLIITAINIIGGLIVGISIYGMGFEDALETYTKLTIGDGLVSQIPALLISTATGIVVSRSASKSSFPEEINEQLFSRSRVLYITGAVLIIAGFIPGFPWMVLGALGSLFIYIGYTLEKNQTIQTESEKMQQEAAMAEEKKPESYLQHLRTEPLEIEIGYNIVPLVDPKSGGTMIDQITRLRAKFAKEQGLIVPAVRIRDNMHLNSGEYHIKIHGSTVATGEIEPDKLLAINSGRAVRPLDLPQVKDPAFGMTAYWIRPDQKPDAEEAYYDVVDSANVIATHLDQIIKKYSAEIMGRREIKEIIDSIAEDNKVVVDEVLYDKKVSLGTVQSVLQNLLKEGVSIRNMVQILEAISNYAERTQRDPYLLTESVRTVLRRQIIAGLQEKPGDPLQIIIVDPGIEKRLREGIFRDPEEGFVMSLKPEFQEQVMEALRSQYSAARRSGILRPVFVTSKPIRSAVFALLERVTERSGASGDFTVLSTEEIRDAEFRIVGEVNLKDREETAA